MKKYPLPLSILCLSLFACEQSYTIAKKDVVNRSAFAGNDSQPSDSSGDGSDSINNSPNNPINSGNDTIGSASLYSWSYGAWIQGGCSSFGIRNQSRSATCINSSSQTVSATYCQNALADAQAALQAAQEALQAHNSNRDEKDFRQQSIDPVKNELQAQRSRAQQEVQRLTTSTASTIASASCNNNPLQSVVATSCQALAQGLSGPENSLYNVQLSTPFAGFSNTPTDKGSGHINFSTSHKMTLSGFGLTDNGSKSIEGENISGHFCLGISSSADCTTSSAGYIFTMNFLDMSVRPRGATSYIQGCFEALSSPLIVDLGRGVQLSDPSKSRVFFDIDGDGNEDRISCVEEGAFLTLPDSQGLVHDINELFGDNTIGPDGNKAANGFAALAKYDDNNDGLITANDSVFFKLRLWKDQNCDGEAARRELRSLEDAMIAMIDLNYVDMLERDAHGNETRQRSVVETVTGKLMMIFDVWFITR